MGPSFEKEHKAFYDKFTPKVRLELLMKTFDSSLGGPCQSGKWGGALKEAIASSVKPVKRATKTEQATTKESKNTLLASDNEVKTSDFLEAGNNLESGDASVVLVSNAGIKQIKPPVVYGTLTVILLVLAIVVYFQSLEIPADVKDVYRYSS